VACNPMPESVRDRVTRAHEYIFMLTKQPRYFYDHDAIKEPDSGRASQNKGRQTNHQPDGQGTFGTHIPWESDGSGRNKRSVWTISTKPYKGAHFAVFPTELIEPCVLAGTSEKGCCPLCGMPWVREIGAQGTSPVTPQSRKTVGWHAGCGCPEHEPVPCTVLDPFSGSGTTGVVALDNGRAYVGLDINETYADLAVARLLGEGAPSSTEEEAGGGSLEIFGVEGG